jgi:ABC-type transporter Mla maintaining outer membrane lipid asymmetry ATPase subunit MlaF
MNFYEITTRYGQDVSKTFMVQAHNEEDARELTDRLFTTNNERIMYIDDKTDLLDTLDVNMTEYMNDVASDIEFVFWTGGKTPTLRKRNS